MFSWNDGYQMKHGIYNGSYGRHYIYVYIYTYIGMSGLAGLEVVLILVIAFQENCTALLS